jgi:hypothetical protein
MENLILVDGEFRSFIRNGLERIIGANVIKKENKYVEALNKLSIRVLSSLLAIYLFSKIINIPNVKEYVTYFFIILFVALNVFFK